TGNITIADTAFTRVTGIDDLSVGGTGTVSITLGTNATTAASSANGPNGSTLIIDDSGGTGNLTVNASAMTGNVTILAVTAGTSTTGAIAVTLGTRTDTVDLNASSGANSVSAIAPGSNGPSSLPNHNLTGGSGMDTLTIGGSGSGQGTQFAFTFGDGAHSD